MDRQIILKNDSDDYIRLRLSDLTYKHISDKDIAFDVISLFKLDDTLYREPINVRYNCNPVEDILLCSDEFNNVVKHIDTMCNMFKKQNTIVINTSNSKISKHIANSFKDIPIINDIVDDSISAGIAYYHIFTTGTIIYKWIAETYNIKETSTANPEFMSLCRKYESMFEIMNPKDIFNIDLIADEDFRKAILNEFKSTVPYLYQGITQCRDKTVLVIDDGSEKGFFLQDYIVKILHQYLGKKVILISVYERDITKPEINTLYKYSFTDEYVCREKSTKRRYRNRRSK